MICVGVAVDILGPEVENKIREFFIITFLMVETIIKKRIIKSNRNASQYQNH